MRNKPTRVEVRVPTTPSLRGVGIEAKRYKSTIRLTEDDYKTLVAAAKKAGVPLSTFMRTVITDAAAQYVSKDTSNEVE
jgi:uncharacterized protein (DUF1778 family)